MAGGCTGPYEIGSETFVPEAPGLLDPPTQSSDGIRAVHALQALFLIPRRSLG